jgi:hypothetical protein
MRLSLLNRASPASGGPLSAPWQDAPWPRSPGPGERSASTCRQGSNPADRHELRQSRKLASSATSVDGRTEVKSGKQNVMAAPPRPCATRGPESSGSGTLSDPRQLPVQASRYLLPQRGLICWGCDRMPSSARRPEFLFRSAGSKTELVSELVCAAVRCDILLPFPLFRLLPKSAEHAKWLDLL